MAKKKVIPQPAIDRVGRSTGRRPILLTVALLVIGGLFLTRGMLARYVVTFRIPQTDGTIAENDRFLTGPVVNQQVTTSNVIHEARHFRPVEDDELIEKMKRTPPVAADDCLT